MSDICQFIGIDRHCGLVYVERVTAQTYYVPGKRIIQQGKAEHVPDNGNGIRRELMIDCHRSLPELKTEPMTHLYTPNIPNDKTGLREQAHHSIASKYQPRTRCYFLLFSKDVGSKV